MHIFQSIILGSVQGITEFLPISSSGHLVAIPFLFRWPEHSLAFDVALHFGTVLALIYFFWKDWYQIIKSAISKTCHSSEGWNPEKGAGSQIKSGMTEFAYPSNLLWQIAVASIPAAIFGILVDKYIESYFHQPILLAINFAFFGFILWLVDKKYSTDLKLEQISYKKSFAIGLAQSIALIPGVSRSGITMTAARMIGLNRENAARYSFLIGMPAMIGAFLYKLKDLSSSDINLSFFIGILASTVFGIIAIKFLLNYLKKSDFSVFLWYRIAFALIIVLVYLF